MTDKNQGEGDKVAADRYNKRTTEFAKSGRVNAAAKDAKKALEGKECEELLEAEKLGKAHSHGEDPDLKRP